MAILDIMGVKGFELLEIAEKQHIPVLMLTAHALRNLASLERLRLAFEEMLVESCAASGRRRAQAVASALIDIV